MSIDPNDIDPQSISSASDSEYRQSPASYAGFTSELREEACQRLRNRLREGQQSMADWKGGPLAVSAVPGAGKSTGMAVAAAIAIARSIAANGTLVSAGSISATGIERHCGT